MVSYLLTVNGLVVGGGFKHYWLGGIVEKVMIYTWRNWDDLKL